MECRNVINAGRGENDMLLKVILCVCIGVCTVTDVLKRTIDIRILVMFLGILTVCGFIEKTICIENVIAGLCVGIVFAVVSFLTEGEIGIGDVCLYSMIIFFMGLKKGIYILFISVGFAFLAALYLVIVKRKKKKYEMPLVPFIFAAYLCVL